MEMTLSEFFTHVGLWLPNEKAGDKLKQLKALEPSDRDWFKERARLEFGIDIVTKPISK